MRTSISAVRSACRPRIVRNQATGSASLSRLAFATLGLTLTLSTEVLAAATPDLGPNVLLFTPDMPVSQIQAAVDAVAQQQLGNQFGTQRYALLFAPGTYGTAAAPLNFQVGYYTAVAGLGQNPGDVIINGSVNVYNQCDATGCVALNNFWRSLGNLTINVNNSSFGCHTGEFWAVSQAAPMRRVQVNGSTTLMDYCSGPSFASGGFIADSQFSGGKVINGSQQQWMVRNSALDGWTNGVWNQVFSGVIGAPANCFPQTTSCGPYTTVARSPVTREAPYLYIDASGSWQVFVPGVQTNSLGASWSTAATAGSSIPLSDFHIAYPGDSADALNDALDAGQHLLLTPGIYHLAHSLEVARRGTVVLGLGFPTLIPDRGTPAIDVSADAGVALAGLLVEAGPRTSPVLVRLGEQGSAADASPAASDPSALFDVFFRTGGAQAGSATISLAVNSNYAILDDVWAWRADHGNGVGWTANRADTGLIVNGDDVTAYGLFVEHYQKVEALWNGNRGTVIFFQNEMPYDPPSQAAWTQPDGTLGYPALKVADTVTRFSGFGLGSYSFFNQGVPVFASTAFEVPTKLPAGSLQDLLTIFLNANAAGGIQNVVNTVGGSSTVANPDTPVTVNSYP